MPIYEYHCKACSQDFELMRPRTAMDQSTKCPNCASKATKRKLSVFAPVRVAATAGEHDPDDPNHMHDDDGMDDDLDCC